MSRNSPLMFAPTPTSHQSCILPTWNSNFCSSKIVNRRSCDRPTLDPLWRVRYVGCWYMCMKLGEPVWILGVSDVLARQENEYTQKWTSISVWLALMFHPAFQIEHLVKFVKKQQTVPMVPKIQDVMENY